MSNDTYEMGAVSTPLETFEWDDAWIEQANDQETPRVLYIGDSISRGTRRVATLRTDEKIYFDGFATSKAVDNPYFAPALSVFAKQQARRGAVVFNNGLHGWHLKDDTEYKAHYERMVQYLLEEFPDTPIALVLTTYVNSEVRAERVIARNNAVKEVAEKYSLPVIDLYTVSKDHADLLTPDNVHFTQVGYELLADAMIAGVARLSEELQIVE